MKKRSHRSKSNWISAFDLDNTLINCNSSFAFSQFLYRKKILKLSAMLFCFKIAWQHRLFQTPLIDLHHKCFKVLFNGKEAQQIVECVDEFVDSVWTSFIKENIHHRWLQAKKNGHLCVILSSSPNFIVEAFAKKFACEHFYATEYAVDSHNRFCNISGLITGKNKALILEQLANTNGVPLKNTIAYSDSFDDIPFLNKAGKAVAVNPDKKLLAYSLNNHWEILS